MVELKFTEDDISESAMAEWNAKSEVERIIIRVVHEAGEWDTPHVLCTQCAEVAGDILRELERAGYTINQRPHLESGAASEPEKAAESNG